MDTAFFLVSKLAGLLLRVESWGALVLAAGLWALWRGRIRAARRWLTGFALAFVALAGWPLADPLLAGLEGRWPARPDLTRVDAIIVLGGAEDLAPFRRWHDPAFNEAGERVMAGVALALAHPQARLVFTGGVGTLAGGGAHGDPAALTGATFQALGIAPDRIVVEDASRTTAENARALRQVLPPAPGAVHVLVTSAFHMPRAMHSFTRAGWTGLVAWPVDYRSGGLGLWPDGKLGGHLTDLDLAIKEYAGLIGYWLAGR